MVSINPTGIHLLSIAVAIYIPLWYLLILTPPEERKGKALHLHSTMVSINQDEVPWSAVLCEFTFHYGIY